MNDPLKDAQEFLATDKPPRWVSPESHAQAYNDATTARMHLAKVVAECERLRDRRNDRYDEQLANANRAVGDMMAQRDIVANERDRFSLAAGQYCEERDKLRTELVDCKAECERLQKLERSLRDSCNGVNCLPAFEWEQCSEGWKERCLKSEAERDQLRDELDRINNLSVRPVGVMIEKMRKQLDMSSDTKAQDVLRWAAHELNGRAQARKLAADVKEINDQLRAELADCKTECERLRLDGGRKLAANAVWMQLCSWLARNGQQELAKKWLNKADAAAADVRPEDFVVASVGTKQRD